MNINRPHFRRACFFLALWLAPAFGVMAQEHWFEHDASALTLQMNSMQEIRQWCVTADGRTLITCNPQQVAVWDVETNRVIKTFPCTDCLWVEAHPIDPDLFYFHFTMLAKGDRNPMLVNWRTGRVLGRVLQIEGKAQFGQWQQYVTMKNERVQGYLLVPHDAMARLKPKDVVGPNYLLGAVKINAGAVRVDAADSLLLTSGLLPQLWNLRLGKLTVRLDYFSWLFKNNIYDLNFSNMGQSLPKPPSWTAGNSHAYENKHFFEAYFNDDGTINLGGADNRATAWTKDGRLLGGVVVGEGALFGYTSHGQDLVAASVGGVYSRHGSEPSRRLDAFGAGQCNCVTPPIGPDGMFLAGMVKGPYALKAGRYGSDQVLARCDETLRGEPVERICVAADGSYAVVGNGYSVSKVSLKIANGVMPTLKAFIKCSDPTGGYPDGFAILPSGDIVVGTSHGFMNVVDGRTFEVRALERMHTYGINDITLSHDGKRFFSSDCGGRVGVWDATTLKNICMMDVCGESDYQDYIIFTPDGYYKTTPNAYQFAHFSKDNRVYGFDQFDLRQNRPDIVMERLGADKTYVELLHKAWLKRLHRKGFTPEMLSADMHVPEAVITNAEQIQDGFKGDTRQVELEVEFSDSRAELVKAFATLNGVPLLGAQGKELSGRHCRMRLPVQLDYGTNLIEVSALNAEGAESYRTQLRLNTNSQNVERRLFVAAIGVSQYNQSQYDLSYATKDARDLTASIKSAAKGFSRVETMTLTDGQFTAGALDRLREFFAGSRRGDVALLFFAGHGVLDNDLDYYLAPHDMDFSAPSAHGVAYDDFVSVLDGAAALSRYAVIDACHSGAIDKEDYAQSTVQDLAQAGGSGAGTIVFRGTSGTLEARSEEVRNVNAVMEDVFLCAAGGGATVVTAASGMEVAVEDASMRNGLFTYCLTAGMKRDGSGSYAADTNGDGTLTLSEALDYASKQAQALSGGRQTPTIRAKNTMTGDVVLASKK